MSSGAPTRSGQVPFDQRELLELVGVALGLALLLWLVPAAAALLFAGHWPSLSAVEAIAGSVRIVVEGRWSDPALAYPAPARPGLPAAAGFWAAGAWLLATLATAGVAVFARLDRGRSRARLGRRPYDPRGARPREWARPRDVSELVAPRRAPGRFTLGYLDRRLLLSDAEAHVAVVAPTRSGKTTRCIVPWLLEHEGPAIVTSTKTDVLTATERWRSRRGRVSVWDPFGPRSARWSPLAGCEEWSGALQGGQWLADAAGEGDSEIARYWRGEAAKLLAPLLHAAARPMPRSSTGWTPRRRGSRGSSSRPQGRRRRRASKWLSGSHSRKLGGNNNSCSRSQTMKF